MGEKDFIALARKSRGLSIFEQGTRGTKKWENAMKKFNRTNKVTCKAVPQEIPRMPRPQKKFATGSTYTGEWNELGISGKGTYTFPPDEHGEITIFEGEFDKGQFDGPGKIHYPSGAVLKGKWKEGVNYEPELVFPDGLEFSSQQWRYCKYPDRRYTVEYDNGVEPAGESYITSTKPPRPIPQGWYDVGYGFFDPETSHIFRYNDVTSIFRPVSPDEQKWIIENCRTDPLEPLGPCPFLFNEWVLPMLEAEDPPIPATKTLNFLEQLLFRDESLEDRNIRQWWKYASRSRSSIASLGSVGSGRSEDSIGRGSVRIQSSRRQSTSHRTALKFITTSTTDLDKKKSFAAESARQSFAPSIRLADSRRQSAAPSILSRRASSITRRQSVLMPVPGDRKPPEQTADDRSIFSRFPDARRASDRQSVDKKSIQQLFGQKYPSGRMSADQQAVRQSVDSQFPAFRSHRQSAISRQSAEYHRQSSLNPWEQERQVFPRSGREQEPEGDEIQVLFRHGGARSTPF